MRPDPFSRPLRRAAAACVGALAMLATAHALRAAPAGVPPLVLVEARTYVGVAALPPQAHVQLRLGDAAGSVIATGPPRELGAALASLGRDAGARTLRGWLGAPIDASVALDAEKPRAQFELTTSLHLDETGLVAGLGHADHFASVAVGAGEAVIFWQPDVVAIMLTPLDVTWTGGVPKVVSPRLTLDLRGVTVDAVLEAIGQQAGVTIRAEGARPAAVSLAATNEPLEDVVAKLARAAGLQPRLTHGALSLVSPGMRSVTPPVVVRIAGYRTRATTGVMPMLERWGLAEPSRCATLSVKDHDTLWQQLAAMVADGDARPLLGTGTKVTRVGEPVVAAAGAPGMHRLEATPRVRGESLVLDLTATTPDAASLATCTLSPPAMLTLRLKDGGTLIYLVGADLKR